MTEPQHDSDRWRELADLLGLPPEDASPRKAHGGADAKEPTAPAAKEAAPFRLESPKSSAPDIAPSRELVVDERGGEDRPPFEGPAEVEKPATSSREAEGDDDAPQRGRRRGGRGRRDREEERPGRGKPAPVKKLEPVSAIDSARSRIAEEDELDANSDEEDIEAEEVEETPPMKEDEDDFEVDELKDWNVPSWNDLIASLYRPER